MLQDLMEDISPFSDESYMLCVVWKVVYRSKRHDVGKVDDEHNNKSTRGFVAQEDPPITSFSQFNKVLRPYKQQ